MHQNRKLELTHQKDQYVGKILEVEKSNSTNEELLDHIHHENSGKND